MFYRTLCAQACRAGLVCLANAALVVCLATVVDAQIVATSGFIGRAVGGVSIDASGVLQNAQRDNLNKLRELRKDALGQVPGDFSKPNELRKVSLRGLIATIEDCKQRNRPIPNEVKLLAGLQRIRYVFVYPEQNDIVLAGFGEGWKVGETGDLVGRQHRPSGAHARRPADLASLGVGRGARGN